MLRISGKSRTFRYRWAHLKRVAPAGTALFLTLCAFAAGCHSPASQSQTSVAFTRVPRADKGGGDENDIIQGTAAGARTGQRIVLYAKSGIWWLQPLPEHPFTSVQQSKWINATHLGTEYAALLVEPEYRPALSTDALPAVGGAVAAVATVKGQATSPSATLRFSGYEWRLRNAPSDRGGKKHPYDPENARTDPSGALHLRISGTPQGWTCAELSLTRSLGYGTYQFTIRDVSHLDPAVVFGIFTWDYSASGENYREVDIETSRWGDPDSKNAQYVIQPFHVPANVARFSIPSGTMTHSVTWRPGRVSFRTTRGQPAADGAKVIAEHEFTSGVPAPGIESVRMNIYPYDSGKARLASEAEVVIEKFEYLP